MANARSVQRGQVGEHGQRLAEGVVDRVRPTDVPVHRDVTAEHVVVRRQVGVAQVGGGLPEGAHRATVAAHLGLREDHADVHVPQSALLRAVCACPTRVRRDGPVSLGRCRSASSWSPSRARPTTRSLTMAQAAEAAGFDAFFRSDHFLAMGGDGLPGPTDAWVTLGGDRPGDRAHPAGDTGHLGHLPPPGPARRRRWRRWTP